MAPDGAHVFVGGIDAGSDGGYHYALLKYGTDGSLFVVAALVRYVLLTKESHPFRT